MQTSTAAAHALSDSERQATQSLAVKSLTYGEIRVDSFHEMLCKRVLGKHAPAAWLGDFVGKLQFMDLGSGTGAAVFAAALCYPFARCAGVEVGRDRCTFESFGRTPVVGFGTYDDRVSRTNRPSVR